MTPLIIKNKDVQKILNCTSVTASRKLELIRSALKKKSHQLITVKEFCAYYDLPFKDVSDLIKTA